VSTVRSIFVTVCTLLLAGCGLDVMYADWKVDRLCKQDGGVKVFETDSPPVEFRMPDGNLDLNKLEQAERGQSYYLERRWTTLKQDDPEIVRSELRLVRNIDGVALGISVAYLRPAQNLGVPFFSRQAYMCPERGNLGPLADAVFFGAKH
jgi:hypothetical protein